MHPVYYILGLLFGVLIILAVITWLWSWMRQRAARKQLKAHKDNNINATLLSPVASNNAPLARLPAGINKTTTKATSTKDTKVDRGREALRSQEPHDSPRPASEPPNSPSEPGGGGMGSLKPLKHHTSKSMNRLYLHSAPSSPTQPTTKDPADFV